MEPWNRKEVIGDCTLYLGDSQAVLQSIHRFDAVVTDPPYGLGPLWQGGGGKGKSSWAFDPKEAQSWDSEAPAWLPDYIAAIQRPAIVWGGNYMPLPPARGWLVWDKGIPDFTTGHSELAWTNLDQPIRNFRLCPNVMTPSGRDGKKQHPTQKPIEVMKWCLSYVGGRILDPFMGSGTTGVACAKLGHSFIGIEIDEGYFNIACERIRRAYAEPDMFVAAPAPQPEQLSILDGVL